MTGTEDIEIRDQDDLKLAFNNANSLLGRSYLEYLNLPTVFAGDLYANEKGNLKDLASRLSDKIRFLHLNKIVFNKKENQRDKLVSVYKSVANTNSSVMLLINGNQDKVDFYLGCKTKEKVSDIATILENSLVSNFSGTDCKIIKNNIIADDIFGQMESESYISAVSGIPAKRSDKEDQDNQFVQGIEKFIDIMRGKKFTMLLIADSKTKTDIEASRRSLETLYSQITPFSESTYTYGANESEAINKSITKGTAHAINHSIANTITHTVGKNESKTVTNSISAGANVGVGIKIVNIGGFVAHSHSVGKTSGTSSSISNGKTTTDGTTDTQSENETEGNTLTNGTNKSLQIKFENHSVVKLKEKIDAQLKRYDQCADLGMWNSAAYFMGETPDVAIMAATSYQSLICGKDSSLENDYIINWNTEQSAIIKPFLMHFEHPEFNGITPGTLISSAELAIQAGLPNHAVPGLPVLECAEFGRNVASYDFINDNDSEIDLGNIFHMNHEESLPVKLKCKSLTSHVFITGSTGAGKSNTVYQILNEAMNSNKKFLVIEPAKGEYKKVFGNKPGVAVYGTNPNLTKLLKINPFSFPKEIHILEHMDRLVEIFNVCWPMYAAMPAVLKEAIEKSYEDAGWNLTESSNSNGEEFPTFSDIAQNIKIIIDTSEYDAENKGAYKGSLLTRLKSLTNGLNGQIFTSKETISDSDLFDKNVIIDLSRVGSQETKSLLMGILVLKLQEHRMSQDNMNADLCHITVLEEAHNLLKKTGTEQSAESSNLAGKSVEMLTNAIAEMRTYGEGFIIADQAPALLDMAVIRNTNTKIVMRLPDLSDRELVGKAANLNDEQINELAKLPCGVAAVYQNEWVEAVLCKVNHYKATNTNYVFIPEDKIENSQLHNTRIRIATLLSRGEKLSLVDSKKELDAVNISYIAKGIATEYLQNPPTEPRMTKLAPVMAALFPKAYTATKNTYAVNQDNPALWTNDIIDALNKDQVWIDKQNIDQVQRDIVQALVTQYVFNEIHQAAKLEEWTKHHGF